LYKGAILSSWGKKMAVAVDSSFFATLPQMEEIPHDQAEVAWLIYNLQYNEKENRYRINRVKTIYTAFQTALASIVTAVPGDQSEFLHLLEMRLAAKREIGKTFSGFPTVSELYEWEED
jgi:hypothetical protein